LRRVRRPNSAAVPPRPSKACWQSGLSIGCLHLLFKPLDPRLVIAAQALQLRVVMLAQLPQFALYLLDFLRIDWGGEKAGHDQAAAAGAPPAAARRPTKAERTCVFKANHPTLLEIAIPRRLFAARPE